MKDRHIQNFNEHNNKSDVNKSDVSALEKKIQRLIDEIEEINKEAEDGGNYKYLSDKYIWKMKVLKEAEKRLKNSQ